MLKPTTEAKRVNPSARVSVIGTMLITMILQTITSALADQSKGHQLEGFVEHTDTAPTAAVSDMRGIWKGHIRELKRHPTVNISEQNGTEVKGTYSGLLGKFPLWGTFDETSGTIQLSVDFSKSRIIRLKRKQAIAVLNGELKNETIYGTASIPEFGKRMVHFEAHK